MTYLTIQSPPVAIEPCVIDDHRIQIGDLVIDLAARSINSGIARSVALSSNEFIILATLAKNAGRFVSKGDLVTAVARTNPMPHHSAVDVFMKYLRRQITIAGSAATIEKNTKLGYCLFP